MNRCLLCDIPLLQSYCFLDLLILRKKENVTCRSCLETFHPISQEHCPRCWKEGSREICLDCQNWETKDYIVEHRAHFTYNQAMKEYFSQYKFQGDYLLHRVFSTILAKDLAAYKDYVLVPIPLGRKGYQTRGFNQVTALLDGAKIAYQELLEKKDSQAQSSRNRQERLQSSQVFFMKDGVELPEKILLVDDIYTTGTTLYLAQQLLMERGVKQIATFSLAR